MAIDVDLKVDVASCLMMTNCARSPKEPRAFLVAGGRDVIGPDGIDAWMLLDFAESAKPDQHSADVDFGSIELDAKEGWRVSFFYDANDLDYIDYFVTPAGEMIDFWEWPRDEYEEAISLLMNWGAVGDLDRLRAAVKQG